MNLFERSISGALLIIVVVIVRAVFINKLPKKTFKLLWGVALVRLLLPFKVPFKFSIYSLMNLAKGTQSVLPLQEMPSSQTPSIAFAPATILENANSLNISPLFYVWIAGVIFLGVFFIVTHLRCRKEYKTALPTENAYVKNWMENHKTKRKIKIVVSDKITAPLTYGVWKPVILLPKTFDLSDEQKLGYILTHEYTHIRYFDIVYKWILVANLCIHWLNPLVWVMYILANRDLELSCDESVIRIFGDDLKSDYALALVGLEEKRSRFTPLVTNFSKNAIEERIVAIMKIKKTSAIAIAIALVLVVGVAVVFATNGKATAETTAVAAGHAAEVNPQPDYSVYKDFGLTYNEKEFDERTLDSTATTITNATSTKENIFLWPTAEKEISSGFNEYSGHAGIDIKSALGTPIYASASGTVITAKTGYAGYGSYIVIDHGGGYDTLYAHCNELYVVPGESVAAGQIIATIGSTGNTTSDCLHFEIREDGKPADPLRYYVEE